VTTWAVLSVLASVVLAVLVGVGLWSWLRMIVATIDQAVGLPAPPEPGRHRSSETRQTRAGSRRLRQEPASRA
jgi:hypothetical protein